MKIVSISPRPPAILAALNTRVLKIVESVLSHCSREKPADAVLRTELRREAGLSPDLAASIAGAVFAFHRWRGWLDNARPIAESVQEALALNERFSRDPASFDDAELMSRAVPPWAAGQLDVTPTWIRALQQEPRLWFRARIGRGADMASFLGDCRIPESPTLADAVEYRGKRDLFRTEAFHAGEFEVPNAISSID